MLPYMGYQGVCGAKGKGFSAILVVNGVMVFGRGLHTPSPFFWEYPLFLSLRITSSRFSFSSARLEELKLCNLVREREGNEAIYENKTLVLAA